MVEQLAVHLHGTVRHVQPGKAARRQCRAYDVFRQKRKPHALLHHLAQQRGAAQFQIGVDGKTVRRHALVQRVPVAHAPLGEQKLLLRQLFQRDLCLPGQRMAGGGDEAHRFRHVGGKS